MCALKADSQLQEPRPGALANILRGVFDGRFIEFCNDGFDCRGRMPRSAVTPINMESPAR
jgi:hypothetical protein